MARLMLFWELDVNRIPEDPKTRATAWNQLLGAVKQDMEQGIMKQWGAFIGENAGYCVVEGNEIDISALLQRYVPHAKFKTHPVLTVHETEDMLRKLTK